MRSIAVLTLFFLTQAAHGEPMWQVAPRATWILPPAAALASTSASGLVLHDRQIRLTDEGDDRYEHTVLNIGPAQAGEHAQIAVSIDPRYQTLDIHALRLTHAGDVRQYNAAQIRAQMHLQFAEADSRRRDLNPRQQVALRVPDAAPGDLLECEYTIHSHNADAEGLFAHHYAAQWPSGGDLPVHWERLRVIWPPARALQYRVGESVAAPPPQVRAQAGELDVQWHDLKPLQSETDTPRWFERDSVVQLSDFTDWKQVAELLAPRYSPQSPPALPLPGVTAAMILSAQRLVESKVHAFALSGYGPYAPAEPDKVLERGYGDSRDVARLLASLLAGLGIEAQVALGDSRRGEVLDRVLPSPFVLDSALVSVRVGQTQYWLNPMAPVAAELITDTADLRHALSLAPQGGTVAALPPPATDSRLRIVRQQFDLRAGNTKPATLTVTTQYYGAWAQASAVQLRAQSPAQLQLMQIQGVGADYPDAALKGPVQWQPQPDGTTQVTARFELPQPFGRSKPQFDFFAESLAATVEPRDEPTRHLPLQLTFPLRLEQHIEASVPDGYSVPPGTVVVENAAFHYQRDVHLEHGVLSIVHRYEQLADHVEPADYPRFIDANARVYQALAVRLSADATWWSRVLEWLGERWIYVTLASVAAITVGAGIRRSRAQ